MKILADKPFARNEFGPGFPPVMLVLLSVLTALDVFLLARHLSRAGFRLRPALVAGLLLLAWSVYYRLQKRVRHDKAALVLTSALFLFLLLSVGFMAQAASV